MVVAAILLLMPSHARAQEPAQKSDGLAPLPLALPPPTLKGTPQNLPTNTTAGQIARAFLRAARRPEYRAGQAGDQ
jgi:hypothetical protein